MTKQELIDKRNAIVTYLSIKIAAIILNGKNQTKGIIKATKNDIFLCADDYYTLSNKVFDDTGYRVDVYHEKKTNSYKWNLY